MTDDSTDTNTKDNDKDLLAAWPNTRIDADNAAFYRGLSEHRLMLNHCDNCTTWHHPPRPVCPQCWSFSLTPKRVQGVGTIALVTVLRQGPRVTGVDYGAGFALVAVELDEQPGLRLAGAVVGTPASEVAPGDRVRVVWTQAEGDVPSADFEIFS